jgi:hypothetical protein
MIGSKKCNVSGLAWLALLIGGLNWGLVGLAHFNDSNWNVVDIAFGTWPFLENLIYILIGCAALASLIGCRCKACRVK